MLGLVLRAATNRPPAEYLQSRIWQPIGAEADATWLVDRSGQEATYCCLNAVLRDYARLGLLLAHDGNWRGRQIVPAAWVMEATTTRADQAHLRAGVATPFAGYGYQTWIVPSWILPGERRMFLFSGIRGQRIYVDPRSKLVMVNTAVHKRPIDRPGGYGKRMRSGRRWCVSSATDRGQARPTATLTRASSRSTSRVSQPSGGAPQRSSTASVSPQM